MSKWVSKRAEIKKENYTKDDLKLLKDHIKNSRFEDSKYSVHNEKQKAKIEAVKHWADESHYSSDRSVIELRKSCYNEMGSSEFKRLLEKEFPGYWSKEKPQGSLNFTNEIAAQLVSKLEGCGRLKLIQGDRYDFSTDTYRGFYQIDHGEYVYTICVDIHKNGAPGHSYIPGWQNWQAETPPSLAKKMMNIILGLDRSTNKLHYNGEDYDYIEYNKADPNYIHPFFKGNHRYPTLKETQVDSPTVTNMEDIIEKMQSLHCLDISDYHKEGEHNAQLLGRNEFINEHE